MQWRWRNANHECASVVEMVSREGCSARALLHSGDCHIGDLHLFAGAVGGATKNPGAVRGAASANTTKKLPAITAKITCDVVVFDRSDYGEGDPQAIDSLYVGDTVQYVGHVTVGDQDIIQIHGRKGYVSSCVEVKP
jgi:hypothetical protein